MGHRIMTMFVLRHDGLRQRNAKGHRCSREALQGHRKQRHPHDQQFGEDSHAAILAQA
jgi:hypothetical protein